MHFSRWLVLSFLAASTPSHAATIYHNDFEAGIGTGWFNAARTTTPQGCIHCTSFLGEFGNDLVALLLNNVPPGRNITLAFDLYVIRSWDGNIISFGGPDVFRVQDLGGALDFQTTFSNNYPFGGQFNQAFPGSYPGSNYPTQTGAAEKQTLGYVFNEFTLGPIPMDAVYHFNFTFPHSGSPMVLAFQAFNLSALDDESWGLDNVDVQVQTGVVPEPRSLLLIGIGITLFSLKPRMRA